MKGQFEIVTKYGNCLHACDDLLFTRQTIHSVAAKHGVKATFIPKLFPNQGKIQKFKEKRKYLKK